MTIDEIIDGVISREGGYVNNPDDLGGPTKFGITEAVARLHGYDGDMRDLPERTAREIYADQFVHRPGFDRVATLSQRIAVELVDTGVNMGQSVATVFLQRTLNALNQQSKMYPDVTVDGMMGNKTLAALSVFLQRRGKEGEEILLKALNCLQGARYIELAEKREKNETFVYGWLKERVGL